MVLLKVKDLLNPKEEKAVEKVQIFFELVETWKEEQQSKKFKNQRN